MKAFAVGALGLVLLQAALSSPLTAPRLGQLGTLASHAVARFVDPTVPLFGTTANTETRSLSLAGLQRVPWLGTTVTASGALNSIVPAAQVESVIREAGAPLLRSVTLFDLYRGAQVGEGRKSLAYALSYQHDERTLTDEEAAKVRGRIVKRLHEVLGAELRAG